MVLQEGNLQELEAQLDVLDAILSKRDEEAQENIQRLVGILEIPRKKQELENEHNARAQKRKEMEDEYRTGIEDVERTFQNSEKRRCTTKEQYLAAIENHRPHMRKWNGGREAFKTAAEVFRAAEAVFRSAKEAYFASEKEFCLSSEVLHAAEDTERHEAKIYIDENASAERSKQSLQETLDEKRSRHERDIKFQRMESDLQRELLEEKRITQREETERDLEKAKVAKARCRLVKDMQRQKSIEATRLNYETIKLQRASQAKEKEDQLEEARKMIELAKQREKQLDEERKQLDEERKQVEEERKNKERKLEAEKLKEKEERHAQEVADLQKFEEEMQRAIQSNATSRDTTPEPAEEGYFEAQTIPLGLASLARKALSLKPAELDQDEAIGSPIMLAMPMSDSDSGADNTIVDMPGSSLPTLTSTERDQHHRSSSSPLSPISGRSTPSFEADSSSDDIRLMDPCSEDELIVEDAEVIEFKVFNGIYTEPQCMRNVPEWKITEHDDYWNSDWATVDKLRQENKAAASQIRNGKLFYFDDPECPIHLNQILSKQYVLGKGLINLNYFPRLRKYIATLKRSGMTDVEAVQWLRQRFAQLIRESERQGKPFVLRSRIIDFEKVDEPYKAILRMYPLFKVDTSSLKRKRSEESRPGPRNSPSFKFKFKQADIKPPSLTVPTSEIQEQSPTSSGSSQPGTLMFSPSSTSSNSATSATSSTSAAPSTSAISPTSDSSHVLQHTQHSPYNSSSELPPQKRRYMDEETEVDERCNNEDGDDNASERTSLPQNHTENEETVLTSNVVVGTQFGFHPQGEAEGSNTPFESSWGQQQQQQIPQRTLVFDLTRLEGAKRQVAHSGVDTYFQIHFNPITSMFYPYEVSNLSRPPSALSGRFPDLRIRMNKITSLTMGPSFIDGGETIQVEHKYPTFGRDNVWKRSALKMTFKNAGGAQLFARTVQQENTKVQIHPYVYDSVRDAVARNTSPTFQAQS